MKIFRGAKAIILDKDNKALVLRRSGTHPHSAYSSDLPGGIIEEDETFEVGLSREILEETGLAIAPESLKLIHTLNYNAFGKSHLRLLYAVRLHAEQPILTLSYEHDEFTWKPVTEINDMEKPFQAGINYANEHKLWGEV